MDSERCGRRRTDRRATASGLGNTSNPEGPSRPCIALVSPEVKPLVVHPLLHEPVIVAGRKHIFSARPNGHPDFVVGKQSGISLLAFVQKPTYVVVKVVGNISRCCVGMRM